MLTHLVRHLWKAKVLVIYYTRINYQLRFCNAHVFHLWSCSGAGLLAMEGEAVLPFCIPLSTGTATPHFPSDSDGSITLTDPSVIPTANWFGSCGCAVTTSGDRVWLLQSEKIKTKKNKETKKKKPIRNKHQYWFQTMNCSVANSWLFFFSQTHILHKQRHLDV